MGTSAVHTYGPLRPPVSTTSMRRNPVLPRSFPRLTRGPRPLCRCPQWPTQQSAHTCRRQSGRTTPSAGNWAVAALGERETAVQLLRQAHLEGGGCRRGTTRRPSSRCTGTRRSRRSCIQRVSGARVGGAPAGREMRRGTFACSAFDAETPPPSNSYRRFVLSRPAHPWPSMSRQ